MVISVIVSSLSCLICNKIGVNRFQYVAHFINSKSNIFLEFHECLGQD